MNFPKVISYFTPDTPYEACAKRLRQSALAQGLECIIEARSDRGSWVKNCAQKAEFVSEMWQRSDGPILWMDADSLVEYPIPELVDFDSDFSVIKRKGWNFFGAQIAFGHTIRAKALIDKWVWYCQNYPHIWDQVSLGYAWWDTELATPLRTQWLPESTYARRRKRLLGRFRQVFEKPAPVIQFEQSVETKRGTSIESEFRSGDLPVWWRKAARTGAPFKIAPAKLGELGLVRTDSESELAAS